MPKCLNTTVTSSVVNAKWPSTMLCTPNLISISLTLIPLRTEIASAVIAAVSAIFIKCRGRLSAITGDRTDQLNENRLCLLVHDISLSDVGLLQEGRMQTLNRCLLSTEKRQDEDLILFAGNLKRSRAELVETHPQVVLLFWCKSVAVLSQRLVGIEQSVHRKVQVELFLRQCHILAHLFPAKQMWRMLVVCCWVDKLPFLVPNLTTA